MSRPMQCFMRSIFALCLLLGGSVFAEETRLSPVSVGIAFEHSSYVIGEDVPVRVLVRNNTPAELTLGRGSSLSGIFSVSRVGDPLKQSLALDPKGCLPRPLKLAPNEERVFDLNLAEAANIHTSGKFFVTFGAIVDGIRYDTKVKALEVVPGTPVSEGVQLFAKDPARQRHFKLVRWPREHVDRLYLRIEDTPDGQVFSTVMLGAYLPITKPRMNIATSGEITVMHRATPDYYVRNVFWSLPTEFIRRSTQNLLDPATADTERLKGMQGDLNRIMDKSEKAREALRLR